MLAKLHRSGELTAVWVPDAAHEAMRNLVRARATGMRVLGKARQHLQGFLLRPWAHLCRKDGVNPSLSPLAHRVLFDHPASQIVLHDYIHAVTDAGARVDCLRIEELLPEWSRAPFVEAAQAVRGVAFIVAVTVVAEVASSITVTSARPKLSAISPGRPRSGCAPLSPLVGGQQTQGDRHTAIAREMIGFLWAITRQVQLGPAA